MRVRYIITLVGAALLASSCCKQGSEETKFSDELTVQNVRKVVNASIAWQLDNMPTNGRMIYNPQYTGWADGVFLSAVADWTLYDDSCGFRNRLSDIAGRSNYEPAAKTLNPANDIAVSLLYANLYMDNPRPRYLMPMIDDFLSQLDEIRGGWNELIPTIERLDYQIKYYPQTDTLDFMVTQNHERWSWCDALYMAAPTYACFANITGCNEYRDFMDREFWFTVDQLYDPAEMLIFRDTRFMAMQESNGAKVFWGRGNGWVVASIARVLNFLPQDYPSRPKYEQLLQQMMSRLVTLQDKDGYWHTSLLDMETYTSPETSSTGFCTYALWWGINNDVLDAQTFLPHAKKAWSAMVSAVHANGMLGWVQPIGDAPENITFDKNEVYGTAAFALAGLEVARYIESDKKP